MDNKIYNFIKQFNKYVWILNIVIAYIVAEIFGIFTKEMWIVFALMFYSGFEGILLAFEEVYKEFNGIE
jgi:hypothetical protein